MNLYLVASLYGKKQFLVNYQRLVELVKKAGYQIQADHILRETEQTTAARSAVENVEFWQKMLEDLKKVDAVFAELSYSSSSAGYIIAQAVAMGKPVVIFFAGAQEPHLFQTLEAANDKLVVARYHDLKDLDKEVPMMLNYIHQAQDTRFNFFVSPNIAAYMDWVAQHKRLPRSVYLRNLLDEDIAKNPEYKGE